MTCTLIRMTVINRVRFHKVINPKKCTTLQHKGSVGIPICVVQRLPVTDVLRIFYTQVFTDHFWCV